MWVQRKCRVTNEIVVPFCLHYCRGYASAECMYKRCRRVRYVTLTGRKQRVRREESCVRDRRTPRELFLVPGQERAILDWTDSSAKIFSQRFDATKPDGRRGCRVLFVFRMNDTC